MYVTNKQGYTYMHTYVYKQVYTYIYVNISVVALEFMHTSSCACRTHLATYVRKWEDKYY